MSLAINIQGKENQMNSEEISMSLAINLFAGILIFLLGLFWPVIPKSYRKFQLRKFWGKAVLADEFAITYGALIDSRLTQPNPPSVRFVKRYHDGRVIGIPGPWESVVGDCEIRSSSYIINTLSTFRKKAVTVVADAEGFRNLNRSFVALGSPSSNEISDLILREQNNSFLKFNQDATGVFIEDIQSATQFRGFLGPVRKDYGIVLKIKNERFPGHFFFVCAGLGEYGTSGASWYLATKWKELMAQDQFGLVVEVEIGSDESAKRVFPD
jgi:hypothetical protein